MHAVSSVLQALFSTQQPLPCNGSTTWLSLKDIAVNDLDLDDFVHDYNSDCMVTACNESDCDSSSVATHDE